MAHDVFISYSDKNKNVATAICSKLESMKIRCWIAPRDVRLGKYGAEIANAIRESKAMIVVFSADSNVSEHVTREVERAVHNKLIIIPFKIENVEPTPEMEYFLATSHWLDAISQPLEANIQRLANAVKEILHVTSENPADKTILEDKKPDPVESKPAQSVTYSPPPAPIQTSVAHANVTLFRPKGLARITLTTGQTVETPLNCLLYRNYHDYLTSLYQEARDGYEEYSVPFEDITSFTLVETEPRYMNFYIAKITLQDGQETEARINGPLFAVSRLGRTEINLSKIEKAEFDPSAQVDFNIKYAVVEPIAGTPFFTPADLLAIKVNSVGMGGFSTSWYDGLPLQTGNTLPLKKLRSITVLESKITGFNGWNMEARLQFELSDGDILEENIKLSSCNLTGVNRLGVFNQKVAEQLKSVHFGVQQ